MHEINCFVFSGMRLQIGHIGESRVFLAYIFEAVALNPLINLVSHTLQLKVSIFVALSIIFQSMCVKKFFVFAMMKKGLHFAMMYVFLNFLVNFLFLQY